MAEALAVTFFVLFVVFLANCVREAVDHDRTRLERDDLRRECDEYIRDAVMDAENAEILGERIRLLEAEIAAWDEWAESCPFVYTEDPDEGGEG
ncbi:MAG TPA: hypothetical protein VF443_03690 [Nitrospira sp.]